MSDGLLSEDDLELRTPQWALQSGENDLLAQAIVRVSRRVATTPHTDLDGLAAVIVEEAAALIEDVQCLISVVPQTASDEIVVVAGAGPWATRKVGSKWAIGGSLSARALLSGSPVETTNAPNETAYSEFFLTDGEIRIGRLIPIAGSESLPDGRQILGVLSYWREKKEFSDIERELMDAYTTHVSLHLVKFELRRIDNLVKERLSLAHRLGLDLQVSLDPHEIIGRLLVTTLGVVRADRATLSSVSDSTITIEASMGAGSEPTWIGRTYSQEWFRSQPQVSQALSEKRAIVGGQLNADTASPEFRESLAQVKRTMTLPLIHGDEVVALLVLSRKDDVPFSEDDMHVMQLIGNIAALALRNARQHEGLREASQAKTDFINMAAHELRTPITVIQGYLDLLVDGAFGDIPEEMEQPVRTVTTKTEELVALINNVLNTARINSGTMSDERMRFDLRDEVAAAVGRARQRAQLLRAEIIHESASHPVMVEARREQIAKILDNLINNAMTYQGGPPWVKVSVVTGDLCSVRVEDHGLGVPDGVREQIFDEFFRIGEPPWNQIAGTGLGLYLSRKEARAMGGELALLHSVPGQGSVFELTLPVA